GNGRGASDVPSDRRVASAGETVRRVRGHRGDVGGTTRRTDGGQPYRCCSADGRTGERMTGKDLIVLPLPETGELVPLPRLIGALENGVDPALNGGPEEQARLLDAFRMLDQQVAEMKRTLSGAIAR